MSGDCLKGGFSVSFRGFNRVVSLAVFLIGGF